MIKLRTKMDAQIPAVRRYGLSGCDESFQYDSLVAHAYQEALSEIDCRGSDAWFSREYYVAASIHERVAEILKSWGVE